MTWCNYLANAIILQAVSDYRKSLRGIKACHYQSVEYMKKDCEEFFESEYFTILTKTNGRQLMRKLQEEYENECNTHTQYRTAYLYNS